MLTHPKEFDVLLMWLCYVGEMEIGEVCYSKYGSYPLKGKYCHEMALRILLACIESHANLYKQYIVPVLAVQMGFYVRVFVRIYTSASAMKNTPLKLSYVYQWSSASAVILFTFSLLEGLSLRTLV